MPTVILLDVSASMCRTVRKPSKNDTNSPGETMEVRQLANIGIGCLLDYFAQNAQLEYTALLVFSSLWEIKHQFTRHHESIKNSIYDLELYDKSNIINAMRGMLSLKLNEWAKNGPLNIILITDGQIYHRNMCNRSVKTKESSEQHQPSADNFDDIDFEELEGQFDFPCKVQVICLSSPREPALKHSLPFYERLVSIVDKSISDCPVIKSSNLKGLKQSAIWLPESDSFDITVKSVEELFLRIVEHHYKPYNTILSCGHLSSQVMLSPSPNDCLLEPLKNVVDDDKNSKETRLSPASKARSYKLSEEINICGFMPIAEIASPAVISRHLVLPIANSKLNETSKAELILSQDPNAYNKSMQIMSIDEPPTDVVDLSKSGRPVKAKSADGTPIKPSKQVAETPIDQDITKQPSFCVLLYNSLKQENMVAMCIVGKSDDANDDWYGMLHPHTDSKKHTSLMLSLFIPGPNPILWLPSFKTMGSAQLNSELPPAIRDKMTSNKAPLKSYSSNNVIWLNPESVQLDVQKIVRHAKRPSEKGPLFYKELNRVRRAAISYGFYDVLLGLAAILEREQRMIKSDPSKNGSQETLSHIDHVIKCLKGDLTEDSYDKAIEPQ